MNSLILLTILLIGIAKWYQAKELHARACAMALTLGAVFLIGRLYLYRPQDGHAGFEVIILYGLWMVLYLVIEIKDRAKND